MESVCEKSVSEHLQPVLGHILSVLWHVLSLFRACGYRGSSVLCLCCKGIVELVLSVF